MRRVTLLPLPAAAFVLTVCLATSSWSGSSAYSAPPDDAHSGSSINSKDKTDVPSHPDAQPSSDALKKEFSDVIEGQLAAFRADDYAKAYTYAAAPIKGMFPASEFETMVKNAYPVIAHSNSVEFGLAFDVGDEAVINVRVEDAQKKSVLYQYMLQKEDGKWKIGGVSEVKSSGLSV